MPTRSRRKHVPALDIWLSAGATFVGLVSAEVMTS